MTRFSRCALILGVVLASLSWASHAVATTLSLSTGQTRYYYFDVPSGSASVTFTLRGSNGDADLYVRRGDRPLIGNYSNQWRGFTGDSNETITIANPLSGRYRIAVHAYRSFSSVRLAASTTSAAPSATDLTNRSFSIFGSQGSERFYRITVPANATRLVVSTSGGSGDVDLYLRRGQLPSRTSYLSRSVGGNNYDTITLNNPAPGTYYVLARGYRAYSGAGIYSRVTVSSSAPTSGGSISDLTNRARRASSAQGGWTYYRVTVPENARRLVVSSRQGTGDVDLYVRRGSLPTTGSYLGRSHRAFTNVERVSIRNPSAGTYYVGAYAFRDFADARISSNVRIHDAAPAPRAAASRAMSRQRTIAGSLGEYSFQTRIRNRSSQTFYVQRFEDVRINGVERTPLAMFRSYRIDPGERSSNLGGLATNYVGWRGQQVTLEFTAIVTFDSGGLGREYRLRWAPRTVTLP